MSKKKRESLVGCIEKGKVEISNDVVIAIFTIRVHPKYWKNKHIPEYITFETMEGWIIERLEGGKLFDIEYTYREIKQGNQYRRVDVTIEKFEKLEDDEIKRRGL